MASNDQFLVDGEFVEREAAEPAVKSPYATEDQLLVHSMARWQEGQAHLPQRSALPHLIGEGYNAVLRKGIGMRGPNAPLIPQAVEMVNDIERLVAETGYSPALFASFDYEDLKWLVDQPGLEAFPHMEHELRSLVAARRKAEAEFRLAEHYYQEEMRRKEHIDRFVLGSPYAFLVEERDADETIEALGFTFRQEDFDRVLSEAYGVGEDLSKPDYFMAGLSIASNREMTTAERAAAEKAVIDDILASDRNLGRKWWEQQAVHAGRLFANIGDLFQKAVAVASVPWEFAASPGDPGDSDPWERSRRNLLYAFGGSDALKEAGLLAESDPEAETFRARAERLQTEEGRAEIRKMARSGWIPDQARQEVMATNPDLWEQYVRDYGTEYATMGFHMEFALGAEGIDDDQLEDFIAMETQANYALADAVDESNYVGMVPVMNFLMSYGRWVDSVGAGALQFALAPFQDEEVASLLRELRLTEFVESQAMALEEGGHTPSGVLGLDGTALGLMLDMGMGIFLDPATWLFGGGAARGITAASRSSISQMMRTPSMRLLIRDMVRTGPNTLTSGVGKSHVFRPFAEVGMIDEAYAAVGLADQIIPQGNFLHTPLGRFSHVADLDFVRKVLDDVDLAKLDELNPTTIEQIGNSLKNKGFDQPLVLELDEATGTLRLLDGRKRLAAAGPIGATKVPIAIKVRRSAGPKPYAPVYDEYLTQPDNFVFHGTNQLTPAHAEEMIAGADSLTRGGLTSDLSRGEKYGGPIRPSGKPQQAAPPGAEELVLVFRKSDLPPAVRRTLDKTGEFEEIQSLGEALLDSPIRPVAWYRRSDGIKSLGNDALPGGTPVSELGGKMPGNLEPHLHRLGDGSWTVSPHRLFDLETMGTVANRQLVEGLYEKALLAGATPLPSNQGWLGVGIGLLARELVSPGRPLAPLARLWRPTSNSPKLTVTGQLGAKNLYRLVEFLGASNPEWLNHWLQRIMQNQKVAGARRLAETRAHHTLQRLQKLDADLATKQLHHSPWNPRSVATFGDEALRNAKNIDEARAALRKMMADERVRMGKQLDEMAGELIPWQSLVDEMVADFVYHNAHKSWGDELIDPDGTINWDAARRGNPTIREPKMKAVQTLHQKRLAEKAQLQAQKIPHNPDLNITMGGEEITRMFRDLSPDETVQLPLTPLELAAISTRGGRAYTRLTQGAWGDTFRQMAFKADAMWTASVLLTPRIFALLSVDELHSFLHADGADFARRYLLMRADKIQARLRSTKGLYGNVDQGGMNVSPRVRERLRVLDDLPNEHRNLADQLMEGTTREVIRLEPGDMGFREAAQAEAQSYLANPAFRMYMRGRDSFRDWVLSPDGQEWFYAQRIRVQDSATGQVVNRPFLNWEEAWELADNVWRYGLRERAIAAGVGDRLADWEDAWRQTANRYDHDLSGRIHSLDGWALEYLGAVEGVQTVYPGPSPLWPAIARGFEKGAADPARTRAALGAEVMREVETARLTKLFQDQGLRMMSDWEVVQLLRSRGLDVEFINPLNAPALDHMLFQDGIVTQGYIARLAEARALEHAEMMTYSSAVGSQAGRRGRTVWRFGQAAGDMFARWGRMIGSRSILRPWLGQGRVRNAVQQALDLAVPFNFKTYAALSRWSARDLEITGGFMGESETELDLSPVTFLPNVTGGGITTLIPGFGPVPILMLDRIINMVSDPINDPTGYQDLIDNISQVVPSMHFHGRDWYTRFTGSGNIGFLLNTVTSMARGLYHNPNFNGWRWTGDVRSELLHSRQVNVVFSDPEFVQDILSVEDPQIAEDLIAAGLIEADNKAAGATLFQAAGAWAVPVAGALDTNLDQLYRPWITTARRYGDLFTIDLPTDDLLQGDQQLLLRTGDDIRRQFFALQPWQRQLILATVPELAANMTQVWEWSPTAPADLPGRDMAYRTTGSAPDDPSLSAALERHSMYVNRAWVIPRDSAQKPYDIIGTHIQARNDITAHVYSTVAQQMNDIRWEYFVSDDTKAMLTVLLDDPRLQDLQVTDPKELWELWSSQREQVRESVALRLGLDAANPDVLETINDIFRVPQAEEAWSTLWQGDDLENWSNRALENPVFLNDEARFILGHLGMEVEDGMLGEEFVAQLVDYRFQHRAAWNAVKLRYDGWIDDRGLGFATGMAALQEIVPNPYISKDFRDSVKEFIEYVDRQAELTTERRPTRAQQDEVVRRFNALRDAGHEAPVVWEDVWHMAFQGQYGPLEWTPPEPLSPFEEDGSLRSSAWQPYIQQVVDGDTILVSSKRGPTLIGGPTPLGPTFEGDGRFHTVRLLGIMAPELGREGAEQARDRLAEALEQARRDGLDVYLVRDPDYARSNTDPFGRELAWLWIGDTPYFDPDSLRRTD